MKNKCSLFVLSLVFTLFCMQSTGCVSIVAGGVGTGGTAFVLGDLEVPVNATAQAVGRAIVAGGKDSDSDLIFISGSGNERSGKYLFRMADDRKITIKYERMSDVYIKIRIRVGAFGDQALSRQINQAIQRHL
jgi:hypothetical protein